MLRTCSLANSRRSSRQSCQRLLTRSRERSRELAVKRNIDPTPDDMMIEREACVEYASKHRVADDEVVIEQFGIVGLERQARNADHPHQRSVAEQQSSRRRDGGHRGGDRRPGLRAWPMRPDPTSGGGGDRWSWRVAVAAPALPIADARAFADLGQPQVEDARLAKAGEIAGGVDEKGDRERKEAMRDQKCFGGDRRIQDEETVGHARKHLRPGQVL